MWADEAIIRKFLVRYSASGATDWLKVRFSLDLVSGNDVSKLARNGFAPTNFMKKMQQATLFKAEPGRNISSTIGFRLEAEECRVLAERARSLGVSPHELARHYVQLVLQEENERATLREDLMTLREAILDTCKDISVPAEDLSMEENERAKLWEGLIALRELILETRKDISVSTEGLLISAKVPADDAHGWVERNLGHD